MTAPRPTALCLVTAPLFLAFAAAAPLAAAAQQPSAPASAPAPAPAPAYAPVADLVTASPLVIDATIRSESRIKGAEAAGVAPGQARLYVEADVVRLIRGSAAIPTRVGWLVDVPTDFRGRAPKLKKRRVLAFARPVPGRPAQVQLVSPGAQLDWSPATEALVRRIATEANAPDAPPVVTGVRSAFHVPGSLPGEGETQIFLLTDGGRPAALSVLRRPGEAPRWSVALSEIIDDGATAPARDTLLWYRLACALPATLPDAATAAIEPADAQQAREDYAFVIAQLGPCRLG
jgi:hypothetical protein